MRLQLLACLMLLALQGCSGQGATDAASTQVAAPPPLAAAIAEPARPKACDLVTAQEMSAILGGDVAAQPNEGSSGKTQCTYSPLKGISPYAEFYVEWGEGKAAMDAAGAMAKHEEGMVSPYDGIGDQAVAVGTVLMIRKGEDLVSITLSGVDDMPAAARRIFDTAKAKM